MNRFFLTVTFAIVGSGAAHASSVIDCNSSSPGGLGGCITTKLANFTTQLDWAALPGVGAINGSVLTGVYTMNNVLPGLNVGISATGSLDATVGYEEGLRLGYNYGVKYNGTYWLQLAPSDPYPMAGHFNTLPNGTFAGIDPTPYGDHLVGLALNGSSAAGKQLQLDFSTGFTDLGFRVSSTHDSNFAFTMNIYSGLGGTGSLLSTSTFNYTGSGGQCGTISTAFQTPVPCNDAPFITALGFSNLAKSITLATNDASGFYIGNMYLDNTISSAPEPTTWVLCSCGVALLALGSRRRRKT